MLDLKVLHQTLDQLEEERGISRAKIIDAIEHSLAAAYKKDFGKKGQIIRAHLNMETGEADFEQVKIVVDDSMVKPPLSAEEMAEYEEKKARGEIKEDEEEVSEDGDERVRFNEEHHMYIEDARRIKTDVELGEELIFPLEAEENFGRIAAQTAKQVIIQKIREAEKENILDEYADRQGDIVSGIVQKVDRGNVFVDFGKVTGILPKSEQIWGERYRTGDRIKAYLYLVEDTPRGVSLRLSRTHPRFIKALFALESPEVANETVEIKSIAREPGNRSKIAVWSDDSNIDPIGALVGQRGVRVNTVTGELSGEKIDIIPWSPNIAEYVANSLAPARVLDITVDETTHEAKIQVAEDQLSLAIGKGGQNVRLAAKLTGWKIDIRGVEGETVATAKEDGSVDLKPEDEGFTGLADLKNAMKGNQATNDADSDDTTDEPAREVEVTKEA